jgi:hypothetical protein
MHSIQKKTEVANKIIKISHAQAQRGKGDARTASVHEITQANAMMRGNATVHK